MSYRSRRSNPARTKSPAGTAHPILSGGDVTGFHQSLAAYYCAQLFASSSTVPVDSFRELSYVDRRGDCDPTPYHARAPSEGSTTATCHIITAPPDHPQR